MQGFTIFTVSGGSKQRELHNAGEVDMIKVEFELSDREARKALNAGLLDPKALAQLVREELRRRALRELMAGSERVVANGLEPLSMAEVQREVNEVRKEHRAKRALHSK